MSDRALEFLAAAFRLKWQEAIDDLRARYPEVTIRTGGVHVAPSGIPGITSTVAIEIGPDVLDLAERVLSEKETTP